MSNYQEKWKKLLLPMRYGMEDIDIEAIDPSRSPFIRDYDRLIFSDSFRRLAGKTQVHPLSTNDHIHTRLSHSLEVASVGRSLGTRLGYWLKKRDELPLYIQPENVGEIVLSACIAHDIGNPPFGHAGEKAIQDWFKSAENEIFTEELSPVEKADFCAFDGNAQGFRVVNAVENDREAGGFCLTYPTIATLVKYPISAHTALLRESSKFNFYESERALFEQIFRSMDLEQARGFIRHPLSYLMEAADDICYRIIDLEDAMELDIISYEQILNVLEPIIKKMGIEKSRLAAMHSNRARMSYLRSKLINVLANGVFDAYVDNYSALLKGDEIQSHIKLASADIREYMGNAKEIFENIIMNNSKKIALEIGSYGVYKRLLDTFIPAIYHSQLGKTVSYKEERALVIMNSHSKACDNLYISYLCAVDFISGMTDSYATFLSAQFAGNGLK